MFKQTRFLLLFYVALTGSNSSEKCHIERIMQIFPGYRCFVGNTIHFNLTLLHPYSCRYDCMVRKRCSFIIENLANDYCLLSNGPCINLIADNDFQVIYTTPSSTDDCLMWRQNNESSNPARAHNTCIYDWDSSYCFVGRFHAQNHLLPGNVAGKRAFSVLNNRLVESPTFESLAVLPGCMVTWMPFTGGEQLPEGVVEGGYFDDGRVHRPLYIMSAVQPDKNCSVYGYYDPTTGRVLQNTTVYLASPIWI